ncbi:MAG: TIGR04053 family radical SAM/SPASM domain-containing protein [Armatimonadetes bacterium]|nr:TIGR04053 family radical SAM/SPASM domain-containing protein [Armatimonadota bacterium]
MRRIDFNQTPFTVVWEVTRACALRCVHCRAIAQPKRHPEELTTAEGCTLMNQIKEFGSPIFVLTGGDPMMRRDLFELIEYGTELGLRVALTPSATALVTRERLAAAKAAGVARVAISLDGPDAVTHDAFRGFGGSFDRTMEILRDLRELALPFQINTTVTTLSDGRLDEMAELVGASGAVQWSVFFVVPTGRASLEQMPSAARHEEIMHWLAELSERAPFDIKSTAAPFYRRVAIERKRAAGNGGTFAGAGFRYEDGLDRPVQGVNDGKGFVFISHLGEVCPSGFLPLPAGNIRTQTLAEIYRESELFKSLRDPDKLEGKCGVCEYRVVCGGSRARAFGATGDLYAPDPACAYEPAKA